jgi:ATP synthase protein I
MSNPRKPPISGTDLANEVARKSARILRARGRRRRSVLAALGYFGLVGWSIVVPMLLGTALGVWIDAHHESRFSWTLMLMVFGLLVGCLNAWRWVANEHREIEREEKEDDDRDKHG